MIRIPNNTDSVSGILNPAAQSSGPVAQASRVQSGWSLGMYYRGGAGVSPGFRDGGGAQSGSLANISTQVPEGCSAARRGRRSCGIEDHSRSW